MINTPGSLRLHVGIFGRRNAGKSSLMNRLARGEVSIVASKPGTTTDPVRRAMEIEPLGPVLLVDTAGLDDTGELGGLRAESSRKVIGSTDMVILVVSLEGWGVHEEEITRGFRSQGLPVIVVYNKCDLGEPPPEMKRKMEETGFPVVCASAITGDGVEEVVHQLIENAPASWIESPPVLRDLLKPDELVVQVMPIDVEAPVGRILLPQVQAVREVIDCDAASIVVKETELEDTLADLSCPPDVVVTDSQAFGLVAPLTPPQSRLTSYSILFARHKGDLPSYILGADALDELRDGDRVLMAEACVHHPAGNDIGRVQIPNRISLYTGKKLEFVFVQGKDYPDDLSGYKLVVHCGGCVFNRRGMLHRIRRASRQGVAITNYGVLLAKLSGVLRRTVEPFFPIYPSLETLFDDKVKAGDING